MYKAKADILSVYFDIKTFLFVEMEEAFSKIDFRFYFEYLSFDNDPCFSTGYDNIVTRIIAIQNLTYCFDDLGTENNLKYFGNECNIMAEILLSRYDLFVSRQMHTHITTNLNSSEIEDLYSSRVRSRLRKQFNLIAFSESAKDKRV